MTEVQQSDGTCVADVPAFEDFCEKLSISFFSGAVAERLTYKLRFIGICEEI